VVEPVFVVLEREMIRWHVSRLRDSKSGSPRASGAAEAAPAAAGAVRVAGAVAVAVDAAEADRRGRVTDAEAAEARAAVAARAVPVDRVD